jgi:hypothetical protein
LHLYQSKVAVYARITFAKTILKDKEITKEYQNLIVQELATALNLAQKLVDNSVENMKNKLQNPNKIIFNSLFFCINLVIFPPNLLLPANAQIIVQPVTPTDPTVLPTPQPLPETQPLPPLEELLPTPGEIPSIPQPLLLGNNFNAKIDWGIPLVQLDRTGNTLQENGIYFTVEYKPF